MANPKLIIPLKNPRTPNTRPITELPLARDDAVVVVVVTASGSITCFDAETVGKAMFEFNTRLEITLKLGLPNPLTGSQPGTASNDVSQHSTVDMELPAPHA